MDELLTIWKGKPHTFAKHRILGTYLQAWMAILSRQAAKFGGHGRVVRFVEGFAGPGVYAGGEDGSPILAIKAALEHSHDLPIPVEFLFIELDRERFESLKREVGKLRDEIEQSTKVDDVAIFHGDCNDALPRIVEERGGRRFGPAIFFLDQFGYTQIPMSLVRQLLQLPMCEVFSYLNWDHLSAYMGDPIKAPGITDTLGSDEWKECLPLSGLRRAQRFLELYKEALRDRGGAKYVLDFAMYGEHDRLINWLLFCTKSLAGVKEMKRAMRRVDDAGTFRFSDKDDPDQMLLLASCDDAWLAGELGKRLAGRQMTVGEVEKYVLTETPCHNFKVALRMLWNQERLRVPHPPPRWRRGSFAKEDMQIEFVKGDG